MENLLWFQNVHMYTVWSYRDSFGGGREKNDDVDEVYHRFVAFSRENKSQNNQPKLCSIAKFESELNRSMRESKVKGWSWIAFSVN